MTKTLVLASRNPAKLEAVQTAFSRCFEGEPFELLGLDLPSGVSPQPMSEMETLQGARNRACRAKEAQPEADFWLGIEGGLAPFPDGQGLLSFCWAVVLGADGRDGQARSAGYALPAKVIALLERGLELGEADDIVFGRQNSKLSHGGVGILTHGKILRAEFYAPAVILALIPFMNPQLYLAED